MEAPPSHAWGTGVRNRPLVPYRSIAVDTRRLNIGQTLYLESLDGLRMQGQAPWGGFIHDGCVIADDRGHGVRGRQLDLFIVSRSFFREQFRDSNHKTVSVRDGGERCRYLSVP